MFSRCADPTVSTSDWMAPVDPPMFLKSESPLERQLLQQPDWSAAAQALIDACAASVSGTSSDRAVVLERCADALGHRLYPALIGVLCVVSERANACARAVVVHTLIEALSSGRLPCGRVNAWGAATGLGPLGPTRSLGPVEYLCATYAEPGTACVLPVTSFDQALQALLRLFSDTAEIRHLYCERLLALGSDPMDEGAIRVQTIKGLHQLAECWRGCGDHFYMPVQAFKAGCLPKETDSLAQLLSERLRHFG